MTGDAILLVCLAVLLCYALVILVAVFKRRRRHTHTSNNDAQSVVVLIPYRNEEASIQALADSLLGLDTGCNEVKFLMVNDHSEDDSVAMLQTYAGDDDRFQLLNLPDGLSGKKAAIAFGLSNLTEDVIVLSADADCVYPDRWIRTMLAAMSESNKDIVCGPLSVSEGGGFIGSFQRLENYGITAINAAFQMIGWTVSGSGANMLYRKKVHPGKFDGRNPSGDDMELLVTARKAKYSIGWIFDREATVTTNVTNGLRGFLAQRLRWGAKNSMYSDYQVILPGLLVVLTNVTILMSLVLMWSKPMFALVPICKLFVDAAVLLRFSLVERIGQDIVYFPLIQLIYPIYIIFIACLSPFAHVNWKGRSIKGDG